MRQFFAMRKAGRTELPSGGGDTLVVAGVEGCVDCAQARGRGEVARGGLEACRPPASRTSTRAKPHSSSGCLGPAAHSSLYRANEAMSGICAPAAQRAKRLPLGQILWGGAESDAGRIMSPAEENQDVDGPAWVGLHHPRIS